MGSLDGDEWRRTRRRHVRRRRGPAAQAPNGCVLPVLDAPPPVAQAEPAPVPPISGPPPSLGISPIVLALLAIAAGVGIYLAVHHQRPLEQPRLRGDD